jgi:hypothetical protein
LIVSSRQRVLFVRRKEKGGRRKSVRSVRLQPDLTPGAGSPEPVDWAALEPPA